MQTSFQPCADGDAPPRGGDALAVSLGATGPTGASLFPPRDADAETRRRWLATSPWPEVVFASAGAV